MVVTQQTLHQILEAVAEVVQHQLVVQVLTHLTHKVLVVMGQQIILQDRLLLEQVVEAQEAQQVLQLL
tara:strand:- start:13 stop:216 length:204 start_codon:yes stop_codon:yes gene_type:complete